MSKVNTDTYCGIYCGACSVFMYGATGCADEFAACLGSVPREEIACGGCKSKTLYAGCGTCGFRDCAVKKGVAHCVDCVDYPCKMYSQWQSVAKLLPHVREAAISLETIKRDGVDSWLLAQKTRWSCPGCGEPFSWYAAACHKCGRKFKSEVYKISGWKKLLCRFVLPLVYRKGKAKRLTKGRRYDKK